MPPTRPRNCLPAAVMLSSALALAAPAAAQTPADEVADWMKRADIARGEKIYAQSCAACHGVNLEGQENWQTPNADGVYPAPPHDKNGHTWHHPDQVLFAITEMGGGPYLAAQGVTDFKSGMPAFLEPLGKQGIADVLAYIQSTWPERERAIQASRTNQQ